MNVDRIGPAAAIFDPTAGTKINASRGVYQELASIGGVGCLAGAMVGAILGRLVQATISRFILGDPTPDMLACSCGAVAASSRL